MRGLAMNVDTIKWEPNARVLQYGPETVQEVIEFLDSRDLRPVSRFGLEPIGGELRMLESKFGLTPDAITEAKGNLLTTVGLNRITALIIANGSPQAFTNSRAVIGVGSVNTAATVGDAALGGNGNASTAWYQGPDATNPSQANGVITCNTTFATGDGNFAWQEWAWGIATAAVTPGHTFNTVSTTGALLNHKIQSLGTKVSGAVWTLQATITLS